MSADEATIAVFALKASPQTTLNPAAVESPDPAFFLHSLRFPDVAASAHPGQPTSGIYTSPAPLPDARVLVSFGASADVGSFAGDYDVYVLDPATDDP